jgi:hypothetical protein
MSFRAAILVTCIREVPGKNLGWDIILSKDIRGFSSVLSGKFKDSALILGPNVSFHILSNSLFTVIK